MKKISVVAVLFAMCGLAEDKIPAGAKQVEPHVYSFTDEQGTKWNIRQTPFGVTKWRDSDIPKPAIEAQANNIIVTDLGDSYRFVRNHPFGQNVWTRKKSDLTADEKALLTLATPSIPAPAPAAVSAPAENASAGPEKK